MSADNWTICPLCIEVARDDLEEHRASIMAEYGKIDPLEWEKKIRDIPGDVDEEKYRTLRENYDIGIDAEGILHIRYFGKCTECEVEFSREISIETPFQPGWEQP